jgi:predicted nucleic acid-binding protein
MNDDRYFLDTNVFVYCFHPPTGEKRETARGLVNRALRDGLGTISFQVIHEFYAALRKLGAPLTAVHKRNYLADVLAPLCRVQSSIYLYQSCLDIAELTGYSFYDSLILAAASKAGCKTLFTEDLQAGQTVSGVAIVNPFEQGEM